MKNDEEKQIRRPNFLNFVKQNGINPNARLQGV